MKRSLSIASAVTSALATFTLPAPSAYASPAAGHAPDGLDEIVVTATPFERSPLQIAQPAIVIAGDQLRRDLGASIGETVADQLGVTGTYYGPMASRPVIRGLGGERVLMLEDGIEALDVSALSADHAASIEGIAADQVEILKGPATLLYGNGAVAGLVNLRTNRIHSHLPEEASGALELRGDTALRERTAAGRLDFALGRIAVHADAFTRDTDDVRIPGYAPSAAERDELAAEGEDFGPRGRLENSDGEARGAALGASYVGTRGHLGFAYSRYETNYGLPGGVHHHHEEHAEAARADRAYAASVRALAEGDEVEEAGPRIDLVQNRYDLAGALDGGSGWFRKLRVRATYSDYRHAELEGDGAVGTRFDQDAYEARVALDHAFGAWRGTAGVQLRNADFVALGEEAFVPASRTRNLGAFVFEERAIDVARGALTLEVGGRVERQTVEPDATRGLPDYSGTSANASGGLVWTFRPDVAVAVNLTHAQRLPTATELYADGPHAAVRRYEIGSADLRREKSNALDLSLRSAGDAAVRWQVNAYLNRFSDFVYLEPTGVVEDDFDVYEFRQDDARLAGVEAEITVPLLASARGELEGRLSGDYVRATLADGSPVPQIPPLRIGAELAWRAGRLDAALAARWYAAQERLAAFERPTEGYTMVDVDVSWRVASGFGTVLLFASGHNLLDEEARRHTSPLKEYAPLPGRSLTAGVRLEF
jgi:iron complex outermembrane receptor protein